VVALAAGALLPLVAAHLARGRHERALAARDATAVAAYLAIVTPAARRGGDYDLPQLLIRARALDALPGFAGRLEIYHATAPLMSATASPLPAAALDRLRREVRVRWTGDAALAPLLDADGWGVVGAVAARPAAQGWPVSPWSLAALLLFLVAGTQGLRAIGAASDAWRQTLGPYGVMAVLLGVAAFADVRGAARGTTDRWLSDARLLMQEAAARVPEVRSVPASLASLARGAEIVPADSGPADAWRRDVAGVTSAVVAVRFGPGRWAELRARPGEAGTALWLPLMVGLAGLGPLGALFAAWSTATAPQRRRETVAAWGFLAPSALHLAAFSFVPLLLALHVSLRRWSPVEPAHPFVGLANYGHVARDPRVWAALAHTLLYALYVPVSMALALTLAVALGRREHQAGTGTGAGMGAVRALLLLPYVASVVATALVWRWMYHPDVGVINHLLTRTGLPPVNWLGDPRTALVAVMLVSVWMHLGYQLTVFLAGLEAIPQVYLDAARVDGASAWQRFWRVTFPLLRPVTLFVLVTGIIGAFQVFTLVVVLTGGGPLHATDTIVARIYRTAWEHLEFGDASALAVGLFALLFGATWAQLKLLDRRVEYG
jgi:multiple sugar transport system permease protein